MLQAHESHGASSGWRAALVIRSSPSSSTPRRERGRSQRVGEQPHPRGEYAVVVMFGSIAAHYRFCHLSRIRHTADYMAVGWQSLPGRGPGFRTALSSVVALDFMVYGSSPYLSNARLCQHPLAGAPTSVCVLMAGVALGRDHLKGFVAMCRHHMVTLTSRLTL